MENHALRVWRDFHGDMPSDQRERGQSEVVEWINSSESKRVLMRQWEGHQHERLVRNGVRNWFSFAIPTDEAIEALVEWSPITEVFAGRGYWARLLRDAGGDIEAYDSSPWGGRGNEYLGPGGTWTEVKVGEASLIAATTDATLLMVWPPLPDDYETEDCAAARALGVYRGNRLAVVGEAYGCTAGSRFWDALDAAAGGGWRLVRTVALPQWWGLDDELRLYERT